MIQESIKEIRPMLRQLRVELSTFQGGHVRAIAARCNKSIGAVSDVLNGKWFNKDIINAAVEYRDELRMKKETELEMVKRRLAS